MYFDMITNFLLWILLVDTFTGTTVIEANTDLESAMVSDFVAIQDRPTDIIAAMCWSPVESVRFLRALSARESRAALASASTWMSREQPLPTHQVMFVLDALCPGAGEFLAKSDNASMFKAPYRWLSIGAEVNSLPPVQALIDSELTLAVRHNVSSYHLETAGLPWDSELKWSWRSDHPNLPTAAPRTLAVRRMNVQGALITLSYVITNNNSRLHLSDYIDKHIDTITKVNFVLTNHVVDLMNGSREFVFASTWGYRDAEGRWDGMLGHLTRKEADVGGSPLFFTSDRVSAVDYIAMPTPTRSKFVFRRPKLSYVTNVFALPFRNSVWVASSALLVVLAAALLLAAYSDRKGPLASIEPEDEPMLRAHWSDAMMLAVGAMCQQGTAIELRSWRGRSIIFFLFLAFFFLYTSYSANVVALLQSESARVKTLSDLLHSRLRLAAHDTVFNRYYFSNTKEAVRKAIYDTKISPPGQTPRFISLEEGVKGMRKGLFAFHMETGVGYKVVGEIFLESEKCGLEEIQYLQVIDPWLCMQKNNSFKEIFKIGMRRVQEFGLQSRENWILYTKKPHCAGRGANFISVALVDVEPAIVLMGCGVGMSIILLVLERMTKRSKLVKMIGRRVLRDVSCGRRESI